MKNNTKQNTVPANAGMVAVLNQALADMIALKTNVKQAHWNVRGANFIALHELFDKIATQVDDYADLIAERAVQLGGMAEGTIAQIAKRAGTTSHPQTNDSSKHLKAVSQGLRAMAEQADAAIETADKHGDAVTADIFTEIKSGLDKYYWFVDSHQS